MGERLSFIRILVDNMQDMFDFYDNIMNLNLKFGDKESTYVEFETGTTDIGLFLRKEMRRQTGLKLPSMDKSAIHSNVMIVIQVEDVDAFHENLKEAGVNILLPPIDRPEWILRCMHCLDPEGNLVEINSPIKKQQD